MVRISVARYQTARKLVTPSDSYRQLIGNWVSSVTMVHKLITIMLKVTTTPWKANWHVQVSSIDLRATVKVKTEVFVVKALT